jgi:GT2 family glycosyltransferase
MSTDSSLEAPDAPGGNYGVVVLNYRNWPDVAKTIGSVLAQEPHPSHVVVVDNASGTGDVARITEAFPLVEVVEAPTNGGYAAGMNLGLRYLSPSLSYALLLTHEVLLAPCAVAMLTTAVDEDPTLAVVGPLLCYKSQPEIVFSAGGAFIGRRKIHWHPDTGLPAQDNDRLLHPAEWIDGSCMLVRRAALQQIGGFDEGYFLYFEETELHDRLRRVGWTVACAAGATAWQDPGNPSLALLTRNRLRFVRRNAGVVAFLAEVLATLKTATRHACEGHGDQAQAALTGLAGFVIGVSPQRLARRGAAKGRTTTDGPAG